MPALAAKFRGDGGVGISFVGDGASNQGTFLESLNLAAVWNLPVIFVVENNGYAESTSRDYAVAVDSYVDRAAGFGLPGVTVDGTDFFAVYEAAGEIIKRAREGGGPALLECKMIRFFGHFEGDAADLSRPRAKSTTSAPTRTASRCFAERVIEAGVVKQAELAAIDERYIDADRGSGGLGQGGTAARPPRPPDRRLRVVLTAVTDHIDARENNHGTQDQHERRHQRGARPGNGAATRPSS